MPQLKTHNTFQDFISFNQSEMLGNYFVYFHFLTALDRLNAGEINVYESFNVIDEDGKTIIAIFVTDSYFLYSNEWTKEMLQILSDKVELKKFNLFEFLGNKDLIVALFKKQKVELNILKDRLVYKIDAILPLKKDIEADIENAYEVEIDEITKMSMANYTEEYDGKGQKTVDEMAASVFAGIHKKNLYVLKTENKIRSIVQVISSERDKPIIGNLYTNPKDRNKGYAYKLLFTVSNGLLKNGYEECGLVSDITNPASNKVFTEIGYRPIYKLGIFRTGKKTA